MRALAVIVLRLLLGVAAARPTGRGPAAGWQEIDWPFPRDAWPAGRAFRCAPRCGGALEVYVRPKIGFCNCTTGVTEDAEVDRVSDLDRSARISRRCMPGDVGSRRRLPGRVPGLRPQNDRRVRSTQRSASRCRTVATCWWRWRREGARPRACSARRWRCWDRRRSGAGWCRRSRGVEAALCCLPPVGKLRR